MDSLPLDVDARPGRRGVLVGAMAAVVAGGALGRRTLGRLGPIARPMSAGTSTSRCAQCGGAGHTMLSSDCPATPRGMV